jgi:hypothetical protein
MNLKDIRFGNVGRINLAQDSLVAGCRMVIIIIIIIIIIITAMEF